VSINSSGLCFNGTSAYVQALGRKPWTVFTGEWPGPGACGQSLSTHSNGTLKEVQQTWGYGEKSGIHGLGINERGNGGVLYSADVNGDAVWTHSITYPMAEGEVEVKEIGKWTTRDGTHPRHLVAHKSGETVHVVGESGNVVLELEVDGRRVPRKENGRWRTVPDGEFALLCSWGSW
jgi:carboxy-cis,cis-muconate cyclase